MKKQGAGLRFAVMLVGVAVMGVGIALFKLAHMGNDPYTALMIAIADRVGVDFSILLITANTLWFAVEWRFGRELIGIGTFINWFGVGPIASLCERTVVWLGLAPESMGMRLAVMVTGIVTLSLACALYQTADMGIAPYDAASLILSRRKHRSYFLCRIVTDGSCALAAFALGGLIGLGTLVCALGLGPFIAFFSTHVAERILPPKAA